MRQTELGFLPVQYLAFATVGLPNISLYNGYHAAIHFGDNHRTTRLYGPLIARLLCLKHTAGVGLRNAGKGTLGQDNPVVLNQFIHYLGKGDIGAEISDHPLQRAGTTALAHPSTSHKGPNASLTLTILRLFNRNVTEGGMPA